jgi:hypothetical protein
MLDSSTKARIDALRDTLVGKLPVPTEQVKQITLGLMYKFMGDLDEEYAKLGSKPFFAGEYEQYAWKGEAGALPEVALTRLPGLLESSMLGMAKTVIAGVPLHVTQPNHVHLVVAPETEAVLATTLRSVHLRYAQHVNWTPNLTGRTLRPRLGQRPEKGQGELNLG